MKVGRVKGKRERGGHVKGSGKFNSISPPTSAPHLGPMLPWP